MHIVLKEVLYMKKQMHWILFCLLTISIVLLTAYCGSRTVTLIAEMAPVERKHCIVIDAGHGGEDGGATSCTGILESTYNLDISLRLNDLLQLMGYETQMIRTSDTSVYTRGDTIAQKKISDLKERVRIANECENAILISIHQNKFADSRYSGAQVFYSHTPGSKALAEQMQAALVKNLNPESRRQCKKSDGIYIMEHANPTAILIECGFLSNQQEEAKLRTKDYQQQLCCVIASTLSSYLSNT